MRRSTQWTLVVAGGIALVYLGAIAVGLRVRNFSGLTWEFWTAGTKGKMAWQPPHDVPVGALGESIQRGARLFNETFLYAPDHAKAKLSCASCHEAGGMQPYASPMVGVPAAFPQFNARAGHVISLKDRIEECFVRSENGTPLAYDSAEMEAIVNYIAWLSRPEPGRKPFVGRGFVKLAEMTPDPARGATIYSTQCSGCHGADGRGKLPMFPPLWGPESFNDGAGMNGVPKMAAFVQRNMPQNRKGVLSAQDAWDVAAFVHGQPRPAFNTVYRNF
jgi:thiosulfate dehydrogenase